jgi:tetratricopeptide (TPR) repeat protein
MRAAMLPLLPRPGARRVAVAVAIAVTAALAAAAQTAAAQGSPRAQFSVGRGTQPYAGVPFYLDLVVEGFEESPEPKHPKLEIAGAKVVPVSATPNVAQSIQIINGRRIDQVEVTWILRWSVTADRAGRIVVPATTVQQGSRRATAASGTAEVEQIADTAEMRVALELPTRPVYLGETVPAKLVWLFRRQPSQDPVLTAPLLGLGALSVSVPPAADPRRAVRVTGGQKDLALPYELDRVTEGGVEYNRLVSTFYIAPRAVGRLEVPATTVVAALPVGRPDFFGNAPSRMFRATDAPRTLEARALPESGRPAVFAGAVGEQFSIEVRASRSVVKLGEPVELDIAIKSNQRLDTLALGRMDGDGRLPKDKFTAPVEAPTGELSEDGMTKRFKVVAQVIGPATELPALAFAYFDPTKQAYQTIQSQPIALSVGGSSVVGAGDVVGTTPARRAAEGPALEEAVGVNAELALSTASAIHARPLDGGALWALLALLHAAPLALLGVRTWQRRTAGRREEAAEVRAARQRVEALLDGGQGAPARELAGPLAAALRDLARVTGARDGDDGGLLARLETEGFAPSAAAQPLSPDLRSDAAGLLRRWAARPRAPAGRGGASSARTLIALVVGLGVLAPATARADALTEGRDHYQRAMGLADASARRAAFARAAAALGEAARALPDRPELLADWGNAALGAGDVATATLAYRRALALDGSNPRARRNLAWIRSRQPETVRPVARASAADALLFFHEWPRARRLLVGGGAFALGVLLLVPWGGRRRRGLGGAAALPLAAWLAMVGSLALEDRRARDAVVMDAVALRAADSAGAPGALAQPIPRGAEVVVLEERAEWTRVRIASGTEGWIPRSAAVRIADAR